MRRLGPPKMYCNMSMTSVYCYVKIATMEFIMAMLSWIPLVLFHRTQQPLVLRSSSYLAKYKVSLKNKRIYTQKEILLC